VLHQSASLTPGRVLVPDVQPLPWFVAAPSFQSVQDSLPRRLECRVQVHRPDLRQWTSDEAQEFNGQEREKRHIVQDEFAPLHPSLMSHREGEVRRQVRRFVEILEAGKLTWLVLGKATPTAIPSAESWRPCGLSPVHNEAMAT